MSKDKGNPSCERWPSRAWPREFQATSSDDESRAWSEYDDAEECSHGEDTVTLTLEERWSRPTPITMGRGRGRR